MNLRTIIKQIFENNSNYTNPSQAVNQASSLNALSGDLYTEAKRFIYELLQNADDASVSNKPVKVWINIFDNYFVIAHSGNSFDARDLRGLCNVNNGTKKSNPTKTGYKGIGFKSVFGQSEYVLIYTNNQYFRFDASYAFQWNWDISKTQWEEENDREFQFPWQIIPIFTEIEEVPKTIHQHLQNIDANVATIIQLKNPNETTKAIQDLSQKLNMFLFLKNISSINFNISKTVLIEIDREKANEITLKKNGKLKNCWLINTINLTVPKDLKYSLRKKGNIPDKLLNASSIELTLAAKTNKDGIASLNAQERLLYAYLPTKEQKYALPVLVNTSFLIAANREALHVDSKWNQWIFKNIALEIFKWIPKLVKSEFYYQAYQLIPNKSSTSDKLGISFNKGLEEAVQTIPFIITHENTFVKVKEAIVDFTSLSKEEFIGAAPIKNFINKNQTNQIKQFTKNAAFGNSFKKLGVDSFEWNDIASFLSSKSFQNTITFQSNIKLIKHFKRLHNSSSGKENNLSIEKLQKLPFVLDHKNGINYPTRVCFPTADDENWNNPNSDLYFLHPELQKWLLTEPEIRVWLESLGMTEKTDITYITQTILPNIDSYVILQNANQIIQDLFTLYKKGALKEDLIKQLSKIKLLTQKGNLRSAKDCYFSDFYSPRLSIEKNLKKDIFLSEEYCSKKLEKDEWKRFFKMLGVKEGISILLYSQKYDSQELISWGCESAYFKTEDKKFKPYISTFQANAFKNINTLSYIQYTENDHLFASNFWKDIIENNIPKSINIPAIAFWGMKGRAGQINGDEVQNYIKWFIVHQNCIPVVTKKCEKSLSVFLNTREIKSIASNYLPIFDGVELSPDWRSFFNFKTSLQLTDYLELLENITTDVNENGKIKTENKERVQEIYHQLLEDCANWSEAEISQVKEWTKTGHLLNTKQQFTKCKTLKYFLDGNNAIFQEQFHFLKINLKNKKHINLEHLLNHFSITILRQSDFELIHTQKESCFKLTNHLRFIIPYFKIWIEHESEDNEQKDNLENLQQQISSLNIYQAEKLQIKYSEIDFIKNVNIHFDKKNLFVTNPWNANSVLLKLSEVLCRYFYLIEHDKKLDFLLRSNYNEIQTYFQQEEINIPETLLQHSTTGNNNKQNYPQKFTSFANFEKSINEGKTSLEYHHISKSDYEKLQYIENLIPRAVKNIKDYLSTLPEYNCQNVYQIATSIIGGITKNGNEITIVARPSDNDKAILYYTSEFDVLEYVDAEFWCEDGINLPKQITFGQLLKKTGINSIPIKNINITDPDLDTFLNRPRNEELDFNPIPFAPEKIARIISSFANTKGGSLIFGLRTTSPTTNEIIGLSNDFRVVEITKKAISLLSPIPNVTYNWRKSGEKSLFIIKTEKADKDVLFNKFKYIRKGTNTILEKGNTSNGNKVLVTSQFKKTIAIVIGIEDYLPRNEISPVKYANADTLKFQDVLLKQMNVKKEDIIILKNENANENTIKYELNRLFPHLTKDDRLIFYYVGHGFHNGVTNYLSTYNTHKYNINETSISLNNILLNPLKKSKCKNALIFIDACAQSFKDSNQRSVIANINDEEFKLLKNEFPYYATFLSCNKGQSSYSSDILKNGIWTYHLVDAISGNIPEVIRDNKYVTDALLRDYLSVKVADYTKKELGYDQNPKAILDASNENVIVEINTQN